jgi:hypothetical protein
MNSSLRVVLTGPGIFAPGSSGHPKTSSIVRTERVVWRTEANGLRLLKLGYAEAGPMHQNKRTLTRRRTSARWECPGCFQ